MADDTVGRSVIETKRVRVLALPGGRAVPLDLGANVCTVGTTGGRRMQAVGLYTLGADTAQLVMVLHPDEARGLAAALAEAADQADALVGEVPRG